MTSTMTTTRTFETALDPMRWALHGPPTGASAPIPTSNAQSGLGSARSLLLVPIGVGLFEVTRFFDVVPASRPLAPFVYNGPPVALPTSPRGGLGSEETARVPTPFERSATVTGGAQAAVEDVRAADLVSAAQNALSLSVTQIAGIVGVSRGTVYNWLRGVEVPRDDQKTTRLHALSKLGKEWRQRSDETLGRLLEAPVGPRDESLLMLLQAPTWDPAALRLTMDRLADILRARAERRQQAAAETPSAVREVTPENIQIERLRLRGLGR